jgi:hypothetical protein
LKGLDLPGDRSFDLAVQNAWSLCQPAFTRHSIRRRRRGLGGNHGVAVAYPARQLSIPARIFVPVVATPEKCERIRGYGADLVVVGVAGGTSGR